MLKEQSILVSRAQKIEDARKNCMNQLSDSPYFNRKTENKDMESVQKNAGLKSVFLFQFICAIVLFLFIFSSQKLGIEYEGIDFAFVKGKIQENVQIEQLEETLSTYVQKLQIDKKTFIQ